jgi:hypothetical protein
MMSRFALLLVAASLMACSAITEVSPPPPEELVSTQTFPRPLEDVSACLIRALDRLSYTPTQPTTTSRSTPTGEEITQWFASKNVYVRQKFVLARLEGNRTQLAIYGQPRSGENRLGRFGKLAIAAAASCSAKEQPEG